MSSFRRDLRRGPVSTGIASLLAGIAEAKGRQSLLGRQAPAVLSALRDEARVASVESSTRIEGVVVAEKRLRPLVLGDARPRDRSEVEVVGYRRALDLILRAPDRLAVTPETLLRLHALVLAGAADAGVLKKRDNEIVDVAPGRAPRVRFVATSARRTPAALRETCRLYASALSHTDLPALLSIGALVLDFLCIHPFRDGNGRVARLLTTLALEQNGHAVGRFVSVERIVENSRDAYYRGLRESSRGWHEGRHDLRPWLEYFLGTLRLAYADLEARVAGARLARGGKSEMVRRAIDGLPAPFSMREVQLACPSVGRDLIRRVFRELRDEGALRSLGRGPGARWDRVPKR